MTFGATTGLWAWYTVADAPGWLVGFLLVLVSVWGLTLPDRKDVTP